MRVIGEIPHPHCKITLFHWNNRYLIKLEHGLLEQTYKIHEYDVGSEEDLRKIVSADFLAEAMRGFVLMDHNLHRSMDAV